MQGNKHDAAARGDPRRHRRGHQGRGPAHRRHGRQPRRTRRSCRSRTSPTPMFGLAVEPKARGDEQKISGSLAKIANEDPTFHVTRDAQTHEMVITGMSQLHLDVMQRAAEAPLRPGGRHARAEDSLPRDGDDAIRRPATGTRSRAAAAASSARSTCASTRCRARSTARTNCWRSSPTSRSSRRSAFGPLRPDAQLRLHRHHRRRHDPQPVRAGGGEGLQGAAGARGAGRLPHSGRGGGGVLRQGPSGGQLGSGVQDGRPNRLQERLPGGPPGAAGADRRTWR